MQTIFIVLTEKIRKDMSIGVIEGLEDWQRALLTGHSFFAESSRWLETFDSGDSSRLGVLNALGGLLHVVLVPESGEKCA